ncbi:MAG: hypothetical protein AAF438_05330 [Pseudomonadota bacterium]
MTKLKSYQTEEIHQPGYAHSTWLASFLFEISPLMLKPKKITPNLPCSGYPWPISPSTARLLSPVKQNRRNAPGLELERPLPEERAEFGYEIIEVQTQESVVEPPRRVHQPGCATTARNEHRLNEIEDE